MVAKRRLEIDQEYEIVSLDSAEDRLKEHPQNPRRGDTDAIDESLKTNGWYGAVVAQKSTGYILAGNHRFREARKLGAKEIPVIWRDVDDEAALRILLADNRTADLGGYDEELLAELLEGLETLDGTGYGLAAVEEAEKPEEAPGDADEDVPDDRYEPQYGVMVVVKDEAAQQALYEWLETYVTEGLEGWAYEAELRVVAV